MSHEGVTLVARAALVIFMIVVAAMFRALVGPGRKRGEIMMLGTLGGMSVGVLVAHPVSRWLQTDLSVIGAVLGITVGLSIAWRFARQIPTGPTDA
jgi:hypothetical protein